MKRCLRRVYFAIRQEKAADYQQKLRESYARQGKKFFFTKAYPDYN